ncbi:hypothetical protein BDY19DRAFT_907581 [Irpex rosettiformis]|uniref:Uncharacterized protein n=1 Tax=Irpex rosettiformis TaxID=378272 RepID=A0ACB8U072_9APHY|nr:hypothetical protein BDY19DRAFT_907581 [Irpex rosettiformis]
MSNDLFFSGDVQGMNVSHLSGIHIQGGCHAVPAESNGLPDLSNFTTFLQYCKQQINSSDASGSLSKTLSPSSLTLNISYCSTSMFDSIPALSNTSLLACIWGLVRCESRTTMGNTSVYGRNLSFDNFQQDDGLYNVSLVQGGEPVQDPLFGALYALLDGSGNSPIADAQVIDALGFAGVKTDDQGLAAVYLGIEHVSVSGRTRDLPVFIVAMLLLSVWLLTLVGLTVGLWRRTSLGSSFDSYMASRLLAQRPDLVEGDSSGGLEENRKLLEKFVVA